MTNIIAGVQKITPNYAAQLLKKNTSNRPLRARTVESYASAMKRGQWMVGPDAIALNCDGTLLNGQHRLTAVVDSGVASDFIVVEGISKEAFQFMDTGSKRTAADCLHLAGVTEPAITASTARILFAISAGTLNAGDRISVSNSAEILALSSHFKELGEYARMSHNLCSRKTSDKLLTPTQVTLLVFLSYKSPTETIGFTESVLTGEMLAKDHPAYALRKSLLRNEQSDKKLGMMQKTELMLSAYNKWDIGEKSTVIKRNKTPLNYPFMAGKRQLIIDACKEIRRER